MSPTSLELKLESIWLRGRDLNPRPLGYETDPYMLVFAGLPCSSVTYLLFVAGVCHCLLVFVVPTVSKFVSKLLPSTVSSR
jgi:hypothetical protein